MYKKGYHAIMHITRGNNMHNAHASLSLCCSLLGSFMVDVMFAYSTSLDKQQQQQRRVHVLIGVE